MKKVVVALAVALATAQGFCFKKALILTGLDQKSIARVKENGFDGVEMRLHGETPAEAARVRALADKNGIVIHSVMANGWYAFDDDSRYEAELEKAKGEIVLAAAYGVDTILVVSGARRREDRRYARLTDEEQAKVDAATRKAFAELIPLAERNKVVLALEFVWNNCWADPDVYAAFVRSFNSPWVKIYLDLGNGLKFAPVEKWIQAAGKDIRRVHIKDFALNRAVPRGGEFVAIGTGDVDFKTASAALRSVGYDGWVTVEEDRWSDAQYSRLLDWFTAGAPSDRLGEILKAEKPK